MDKPAVVYHYTSADTLLKIAESESVWATNLRYLNDLSEADHCVRMMRERLSHYRVSGERAFAGELSTVLGKSIFDEWNIPYVASFSNNKDSLPQWRSYCSMGNGVSVGFRVPALEESTISDQGFLGTYPPQKSVLHEVQYLNSADWRSTDELIESCVEELRKWKIEEADTPPAERLDIDDESVLQVAIMRRACLVKHDGFASEREYRLIAPRPWGIPDTVRFRASRTTVVPYVAIKMPKWGKCRDESVSPPFLDYFIEEVVVGPTPNPDLTVSAIRSLFRSKGIPLEVKASEIPYRDL